MIERYTSPQMGAVWSDDRKFGAWLTVELAVCEAWHDRGRIPGDVMPALRAASFSADRIREIERETDHDVIAFLRAVGESVGEASRYVHLGLTSSDVVDTGLALQTKAAGDLIDERLTHLIATVGRRAVEFRDTVTIGRTHGIHAEPTTFGLKLAIWYDELRRQRSRLDHARSDMAVGAISGAVGTHAHVPPDLERDVCAALGLQAAPASNQVVQRDRHAFFMGVLAGLGATLEKMSVELRHLQRTEVRETQEPFAAGNQGSSAMPHKRNPHASERISGLARLLRGYAGVAIENVALWHERDISHSSAERVIFPDACIVTEFMLVEMDEIVAGLTVFPNRMRQNLDLTAGLIYSQQVMLALVDAGMPRQDAYKLVQRHALRSWDEQVPFRALLESDPDVRRLVSNDELDRLFDPLEQLVHVEEIFARLGLDGESSVPRHEDAEAILT